VPRRAFPGDDPHLEDLPPARPRLRRPPGREFLAALVERHGSAQFVERLGAPGLAVPERSSENVDALNNTVPPASTASTASLMPCRIATRRPFQASAERRGRSPGRVETISEGAGRAARPGADHD
jgi:hypothetical protein